MAWLFAAILAHFFLAISSVGDRFFLTGSSLRDPKVYSFYTGVAPLLVVPFLFPFASVWPDTIALMLGFIAGLLWLVALWAYFSVIAKSEVSRVVPATGAFMPIFVLVGSLLMSHEMLAPQELFAFALLIMGGILITVPKPSLHYFFHDHVFIFIISAAFLFASSFLLNKAIFLRVPFVEGLILMLIGRASASLILLVFPAVRSAVFKNRVGFKKQVAVPFVGFQLAGGLGAALYSASLFLVEVRQISLVNALEGVRYLFLFAFVWLIARWSPKFLKEEMHGAVLRQKVVAGAIIIFGISLLAFGNR